MARAACSNTRSSARTSCAWAGGRSRSRSAARAPSSSRVRSLNRSKSDWPASHRGRAVRLRATALQATVERAAQARARRRRRALRRTFLGEISARRDADEPGSTGGSAFASRSLGRDALTHVAKGLPDHAIERTAFAERAGFPAAAGVGVSRHRSAPAAVRTAAVTACNHRCARGRSPTACARQGRLDCASCASCASGYRIGIRTAARHERKAKQQRYDRRARILV